MTACAGCAAPIERGLCCSFCVSVGISFPLATKRIHSASAPIVSVASDQPEATEHTGAGADSFTEENQP